MSKIIHLIFKTKLNKNLFFVLLAIVIFILSKNFGMFDDDILFGSKMGNHLYNTSLFNWSMPISFDPGHPPFLGTILALFWHIFGHELWVSHFAMIPFTIGFFIQLHKFISYFIEETKLQFFAFFLVLADPSLATCLALVSIEIITLFFFFLAVNSLLFNHKKLQFIGLFFLSIVSFRSMMLFAGICLYEVLYRKFLQKEDLKKIITLKFIVYYFTASLPAFMYVGWRFLNKGWLQTHINSPWKSLWHFADFNYFIRNSVVLIWRYLDFGRIFIMLFIIISFIIYGKKIINSTKSKLLLLLAFSSVLFIISTILIVTNTVGILYFITSYICLNLFAFLILVHFYKHKKLVFSILFFGLITGNLWIYPKPISTAFRATLGHVPYHSIRLEAIDYLNTNNIDIETVASFFPNYTTLDLIDFSGDQRSFLKFTGAEKYVFYANIYNLTDEELKSLENNYTILKEFNNFNITIKIYILKVK
jgi:hypothetical protein